MRIWPFPRKAATPEQKSITAADLDDLATGGTTFAGVHVSTADALRVPAVAASIQIISEAAACLDLFVKRRVGASEVDDEAHPVLPLLRGDANDFTSAFELIRQIVVDALTMDQGGMVWVNRVGGKPVELLRFNLGVLSFERDVNTNQRHYRRFGSPEDARNIVHLLPPLGRAPLSLAREAIGTAVALDRHTASFFANGARPSGILKLPTMTEEALKTARSAWNATHGDGQSGKTAVLLNGGEYIPLTMTSADGQLLESRRFQIEEIARAFNLSPVLLGDLTKASYASAEHKFKEFVFATLEPWLRALEGALTRALIGDDERGTVRIAFDRDDISRADLATRATVISSLIASRVINPNIGASWIGLPPHEGGNEYLNPAITPTPAADAPPQDVRAKDPEDEPE